MADADRRRECLRRRRAVLGREQRIRGRLADDEARIVAGEYGANAASSVGWNVFGQTRSSDSTQYAAAAAAAAFDSLPVADGDEQYGS